MLICFGELLFLEKTEIKTRNKNIEAEKKTELKNENRYTEAQLCLFTFGGEAQLCFFLFGSSIVFLAEAQTVLFHFQEARPCFSWKHKLCFSFLW